MELEHSTEPGAKHLSLDINRVLTALKLVLEILRVRYGYWVTQSVTLLTCNSEGAVFQSRPAHPLSWLKLFCRLNPYIQHCAALVTQSQESAAGFKPPDWVPSTFWPFSLPRLFRFTEGLYRRLMWPLVGDLRKSIHNFYITSIYVQSFSGFRYP
jgi:hypothetical protein